MDLKINISLTSNIIRWSTAHYLDIITDSERRYLVLVLGVIVCGIVSLFGSIVNIINMIIFYKQGLHTTINISFFSMAISDLGSLVFQQLCNVYDNPLFEKLDLPIVYHEFQYFTAAIMREVFFRITFLLTVYVTAERCFCIVFPLHVKQMITPRRTTAIIICFYTFMLSSISSLYSVTYIEWTFHPIRNRTLLGLVSRQNKDIVEGSMYLSQAILGILSFILIVLLTVLLVYTLQRKNAWLKNDNVSLRKKRGMSKKEKATVAMVILIASILIISYFPSVILLTVTIIEPEFSIGGRYKNMFIVLWTSALMMENINSSVNIFFYYNMSTKYRQTFRVLFFIDTYVHDG